MSFETLKNFSVWCWWRCCC